MNSPALIEELVDGPIVPRKIGACTNPIDLRHWCLSSITDQDIEAVELPKIGRRRQFICGKCYDNLFALKPLIDLQEKIVKKKPHRLNGNKGKPHVRPKRNYW